MIWQVIALLVLLDASVGAQFERDESYFTYEFAFLLAPKEISCFYQYLHAGSQLKFSYKVLTSPTTISHNHINVAIRGPRREVILDIHMHNEADIPMFDITNEGDHEFCYNNYHGRFLAKTVDTYIGVKNPRHILDNQQTNQTIANTTAEAFENLGEQITSILSNIFPVTHFMSFQRRMDHADLALLEANQLFVNRCSFLLTITIVFVAAAQTYSLKRLFRVRLQDAAKPRA